MEVYTELQRAPKVEAVGFLPELDGGYLGGTTT